MLGTEGVLHPYQTLWLQLLLPTHPRFIKILDSVLHHLVPAWDHTLGTFSEIKVSLVQPVLVSDVGSPFLLMLSFTVRQRVLKTYSRPGLLLGSGYIRRKLDAKGQNLAFGVLTLR